MNKSVVRRRRAAPDSTIYERVFDDGTVLMLCEITVLEGFFDYYDNSECEESIEVVENFDEIRDLMHKLIDY